MENKKGELDSEKKVTGALGSYLQLNNNTLTENDQAVELGKLRIEKLKYIHSQMNMVIEAKGGPWNDVGLELFKYVNDLVNGISKDQEWLVLGVDKNIVQGIAVALENRDENDFKMWMDNVQDEIAFYKSINNPNEETKGKGVDKPVTVLQSGRVEQGVRKKVEMAIYNN